MHYDRIDINKGIDPTKSCKSKECMICHYWFFNHGLKFQDHVCNCCHDLTMLSANISDAGIIIIEDVDYGCIIHNSSKSEAINLLKIIFLKIFGVYKNIVSSLSFFKAVFLLFLFSIYKMIYIMKVYKSLNISIVTVMKNSEMVKFVPDHLKTKKLCKHAVKKLPYVLKYVPDQCSSQ